MEEMVNLSLDHYNELREFKERIEEDWTCRIRNTGVKYIGTDDALKDMKILFHLWRIR